MSTSIYVGRCGPSLDRGQHPPRTRGVQRHYFIILDELWRALRGGRGMVDRVDALTRLDRQRGVGRAMISHTMSDLQALADEDDRMKARGFVERSGMASVPACPRAR
jgi:hypothetical protein